MRIKARAVMRIKLTNLDQYSFEKMANSPSPPNAWTGIPDEIVNKILYESFSPTKYQMLPWHGNILPERAVLSGIDRRTRTIVDQDIHFWDLLTIRRTTPQDALQAWLEKTTACDLTVRIHAEALTQAQRRRQKLLPVASFEEFLTQILPLLQQDLGRVRNLNITANNQKEALTTLQALGSFGMGNVRQLRVYNGKYGPGEGPGGPLTLPPMPHLQQLVLGKINPFCLGAPVFSRLTSLRLGDILGDNDAPGPFVLSHASGRTLAALTAAPQLVILHLDGVWDGIISPHPRIILPCLQDFWLSCRDEETLSLAAALEMPHLRRFRVEIKDTDTTALLTSTCQHLLSKATWVELRLDDNDAALYRDFCSCTTSVECLDLRGCHEFAADAIIELARAGRLPAQLTHLRMSCPVMRSQLADILIQAPQIVCLTSGQEIPCREPNRRSRLEGTKFSEEYFEEDQEETYFGRWIHIGNEAGLM
ncbi:hypothetical protein C8R43DRAFT_1117843 [Mycena crocata]|nr:hypothetical protein C8R43DRAFT_1117843 [Mycena crocata]